TTITFDLPVAAEVRLDVFDINGRNVSLSGSGTTPTTGLYAPGTHSITFDGSGLASGIYLYRLEAGNYTASGKMVLMK
ncbi:MAG: T9SS type A sorting domain-containing protein, partial [bacterium]